MKIVKEFQEGHPVQPTAPPLLAQV